VNLPVGSECFVPSVNAALVLVRVFRGGPLFLSKGNERIAVLENVCGATVSPISSPKPPNPVLSSVRVTYKHIVPLVLIEVCELVEFAFYHIKKLPRILRFALRDLRDLEQSLLTQFLEVRSIVMLLLRRIRRRRDSEREV